MSSYELQFEVKDSALRYSICWNSSVVLIFDAVFKKKKNTMTQEIVQRVTLLFSGRLDILLNLSVVLVIFVRLFY